MRKGLSLKNLILGVSVFWVLCAIGSYLLYIHSKIDYQFAEIFGIVNSLFSALAFAVIIYTVYLQKKELGLQRKELKYTREELKRTAEAQENSAKFLSDQIRLDNFPFLDYDSEIIKKSKYLIISNNSDNPAFDIDIWFFSYISNEQYSFNKFIDKYVMELWKSRTKISKLIDGIGWNILERGVYPNLSKDRKIFVDVDYPVSNGNYSIFIQYRDKLGNNYYNVVGFTEYANYETDKSKPFSGIRVYPEIPTIIKRIDWEEIPKSCDDLPKNVIEILDAKESSILVATTNFKDFRSANFKWMMS